MRCVASPEWLVAVCLAALGTQSCVTPDQVERLVDGHPQIGHFVDDRAYAYYARGRLLELEGDVNQALDSYSRAQAYDGQSVELALRTAAALCQLRRAEAFSAFDSALELDRRYAPLWVALSRCYVLEGDRARALETAETAVSLDPTGLEPNAHMFSLLEAKGDQERIRAWSQALLTYSELDPLTLTWLQNLATAKPTAAAKPVQRLPASELALLELRAGNFSLARSISQSAYAADPTDANSWMVLLSLAMLERDDAEFERLVHATPSSETELTPASLELLKAVLSAKVGESVMAR